jgi:hypothetical protein
MGWECSHLLTECTYVTVREAREKYLHQNISYISGNIVEREATFVVVFGIERQCTRGREDESGLNEDLREPSHNEYLDELAKVVSIYLLGGLYRPFALSSEEGWADTYQMGFGALRIITPGFETYGFCYVAQFLQVVSPLYVSRLCGSLYGDMVSDIDTERSDSVSSREEPRHSRWNWIAERNDSTDDLSDIFTE